MAIKEYVKLVSKDELDLTKVYTHQKMGNILKVVDKVHRNSHNSLAYEQLELQVREKFPTVDKFDKAWPIHELVMAHLTTCLYAVRLSAKHN